MMKCVVPENKKKLIIKLQIKIGFKVDNLLIISKLIMATKQIKLIIIK